jgi:hypothetical protein
VKNFFTMEIISIFALEIKTKQLKSKKMKKIAFLFLIIFFALSCTKPEAPIPDQKAQTPETSATKIPVTFEVTITDCSVYTDPNGKPAILNGKIKMLPTSGVPPLKYKLGVNEYQLSDIFSNLIAGTYTVIAQDSKGTISDPQIIVIAPAVIPLIPLAVTVSFTNVLVYGQKTGTIAVTVTSGMPPYNYYLGTTTTTDGKFLELSAGTYELEVTDSKNLPFSQTITITEPAKPVRIMPVYALDLLSASSDFSSIAPIFNNQNKFTVSFWYNTIDKLNNYVDVFNPGVERTMARMLTVSSTGSEMFINLTKGDIKFYRSFTHSMTGTSETAQIEYKTTTAWTGGPHHLVITYDGAEIKMYLDNSLVGSQTTSMDSFVSTNVSFGGAGKVSGYLDLYKYAGIISKIKIYNEAIDAAEVNMLFNHQ